MRVPGGRAGGFGCLGLLIVIVISVLTGADPRALLGILGLVQEVAPQAQTQVQHAPVGAPKAGDKTAEFVGVVLKDTENTWTDVFQKMGRQYRKPTLVLFEGRVASACGLASSAVGPFYCPSDGDVYLDTAFFRELSQRFGAPGDFAAAYVVAHEVGHHVQNVLGTMQRVGPSPSNPVQVRLELQADCYAGVWGHFAAKRSAEKLMAKADTEIGLRAVHDPFADRLLLGSEPGILLLLPRILSPPKNEKKVVGGEIRDVLPFEETYVFRDDPVLREEVEKSAGMVVVHVLEDKGALHDSPISRAA